MLFLDWFYFNSFFAKRLIKKPPRTERAWNPACFASDVNLIDFASLQSGKDAGLKKIAEYYGVDISEVIAIGDSQNDADMLKVAGLGVAVQNAWPEAKAAADYVTEKIADDGAVAEVIEKFCLN